MSQLTDSEKIILSNFLEKNLKFLKDIYNAVKETIGGEILVSLDFKSGGPDSEARTYFHALEQGLENLRCIDKDGALKGLIQHVQDCRLRPDWKFGLPLLCCFEKPGQRERKFWFSLCEEKFAPPVQAGRN